MKRSIFLLSLFVFPTLLPPRALANDKAVLQSGDRIAFLGNTVVERARHFGEIEAALQIAAGPDISGLTFRNIGWSGDSVFCDSRSYFGTPEEGRKRLASVLDLVKPNVLLICYGSPAAMSVDQGWTNEKGAAATSAAGLEKSIAVFIDGYRKMLKIISDSAGKELRETVLISPPPLENLPAPLPDQARNNRNIARFRDAIRNLAKEKGLRFIDLFAAMGGDNFSGKITEKPLTNNGVHYGRAGYRIMGRVIAKELVPGNTDRVGELSANAEKFRSLIVEKNTLFFNRWRPANETYLFLFRKHEQGNNAKEIPMFDPLIKAKDQEIEAARKVVLKGAVKN